MFSNPDNLSNPLNKLYLKTFLVRFYVFEYIINLILNLRDNLIQCHRDFKRSTNTSNVLIICVSQRVTKFSQQTLHGTSHTFLKKK